MADEVGGEQPDVRSRFAFWGEPYFCHRIVVLLCAIAVSAPVMYKSRLVRDVSSGVAFSVSSTSQGSVRVSGDVRYAGIYPVSANTVTSCVIKMAEPLPPALDGRAEIDAAEPLINGMALHVTARPNQNLQLEKSQMGTNERLVLGIPLDINAMSEADFDRVPGIGPVMANRIVMYRHNNGGRLVVDDLLRIEGIGEKKYNQLHKYF